MKIKEFKSELFKLLSNDIDNMSYEEKINLIYDIIIEFEKDNENFRDMSNKGQKWTDDELKIILSDASTKLNCIK